MEQGAADVDEAAGATGEAAAVEQLEHAAGGVVGGGLHGVHLEGVVEGEAVGDDGLDVAHAAQALGAVEAAEAGAADAAEGEVLGHVVHGEVVDDGGAGDDLPGDALAAGVVAGEHG